MDYGQGVTNIDLKSGIRYGVINQHHLNESWFDSSEPYYGEEEPDECSEPISWYIDDEEYRADSDDYGDIFITRSPYFTYCGFCSPCAPGAGDLMAEGNVKAYCFGHDFFEGDVAPYDVYDVITGNKVTPWLHHDC